MTALAFASYVLIQFKRLNRKPCGECGAWMSATDKHRNCQRCRAAGGYSRHAKSSTE